MYLVALTRWNSTVSIDAELPALAPAIGLAPYDARLRLVTATPTVLASGLALGDAQRLLGLLRERGHGAVACDADTIPAPERALLLRGFALEPDTLVGLDVQRRPAPLHYADIIGIARAVEISSQSHAVESTEKKLDVGRALLSGGLVMSRTVSKVETSDSFERHHVAYLFRNGTADPVLLKEHLLSYEGLGAARGASAHASFEALLAALRAATPAAMHDDRLLTHKRRPDLTAVRGAAKDRTVNTSNEPANALAAHLLMLAHLQGQL